MLPQGMFGHSDVVAAVSRLRGVARRTPLLRSVDLLLPSPAGPLSSSPGPAARPVPELYLKAENLQLTHAFKFRGAYNRVAQLSAAERSRGLVAASSGNHALGLSLAGALLGASVTVVMPEGAPIVKELGCRAYGAQVIRHGQVYDDALARATAMAAAEGMVYVPSFDDPQVAAGQATVAWEILEDLPDVDVIVAPIGGGGLLSGLAGLVKTMPQEAVAAHFPARRRPLSDIHIVGVQAAGAASMIESVRAGRVVALPSISTIADGIAVRKPGRWTYEVISSLVDDYITVSDDEILQALARTLLKEKLLIEPAGAAAVAAVLCNRAGDRVDLPAVLAGGGRVVCVLSGGNVEPKVLGQALA
ncbi:MAG: pyridoxal-phosphate dependent enzyme [Bacillota bacterium]|nr:pyridoxal-phosphate dependent enzyme [Bacillota bacterium]